MRVLTGFAGVMMLVYASAAAPAVPAPAPKPDLQRGKQIATTVCVACHQADGNSTTPSNPVLAGQQADYIVAQLTAFKSGARQSPIMQGMAASLSPEDMPRRRRMVRVCRSAFRTSPATRRSPNVDSASGARG